MRRKNTEVRSKNVKRFSVKSEMKKKEVRIKNKEILVP